MARKNKIGLALSSGGIRGISHIGVIKALLKNNIPIDFISGSSAGSIVGAYFAINGEVESLEKILLQNSKELVPLFFDLSINEGFVNGNKINTYLNKLLKNAKFSDTKIPLFIVGTDILKCESVVFSSGEITPAVRGSISIPIIFKPFKNKDKILVDGGLSNPVPADILKKNGAGKVISVNLYPKNKFSQNISISNMIVRSTYVGLHFLSENAKKYSDVFLEPNSSLYLNNIKLSDSLKPENIKKLISIGEKETLAHIEEIKKIVS